MKFMDKTTPLLSSTTTGLRADQTLANLDTGTTLATIPSVYADAIFGDVEHTIDEEGNIIIACDTKLNMSFVFG